MTLTFGGATYADVQAAFRAHDDESCAILLASEVSTGLEHPRLLVREIHLAPEQAYVRRSHVEAELRPEALVALTQRARNDGLAVVFAHSHPHAKGTPVFSKTDDLGEVKLAEFLARRVPNRTHAALVLSEDGCAARVLGTTQSMCVLEVNANVKRWTPLGDVPHQNKWDRQVRVFGSEGQAAIQRCRVAIVGLGGTGSIVCQQLAHLGVAEFLLIDPDTADETNLNRLVGASRDDIGKAKVDIARRMVSKINRKATVIAVNRDVADVDVAKMVVSSDAIFSCTDSHASRAVLNQVAYQYLMPLFDVGVGIVAKDGAISHIAGRTQMAAPGLPCLICAGVIDSNAVRIELQSEIHRAADPYIVGHHEPQPAVISLNGTVSSMAVTMFMAAFTGLPMSTRLQYYNGLLGTVRAATLRADPSCIVCSRAGCLARGDSWPLFGRTARA